MADNGCTQPEWQTFHRVSFEEAGKKVDQAIARLSTDLNLASTTT
jgi:hypothetical protein